MLSDKQKKAFRAQGHHLQPVVLVGKDNVTDGVLEAVDGALTTHELIKVKVLQSATVDKDEAAQALAQATGAELVQRIGRVVLLYRPRPEQDDE